MSQEFLEIWAGVPLIPGHFRRRIMFCGMVTPECRCDLYARVPVRFEDLYARVRCDLLCLKGDASRAVSQNTIRQCLRSIPDIGSYCCKYIEIRVLQIHS